MHFFNKKILSILTVSFLCASFFIGCTPTAQNETAAPQNQKTATADNSATKEKKPLKVAIVVAAGLGDESFYDSTASSLTMLKEIGIEGQVFECQEDPILLSEKLVAAAEYADIIVPAGWQFSDHIKQIAPEFPEKKFIYVDEAVEGLENVMNIKYKENDGSFLVGYIAASVSKTGKIGVVGGADSATINNFIVGYTQGAKAFSESIIVEKIYSEDYEDPAKGKECALALHSKGCDVIYAVAGKTGNGVFEAAKEVGIFAIGVDSDQKHLKPETIVASMVKNVGLSVFDAISKFSETGEFLGGETKIVGIKENCISVGYGTADSPQQVSEQIKATVVELQNKIVSGEIVVDSAK